MSRDDVTIRQHRSRLLQLAESTSSNSSGKRRGFSNAQLLRSNGGSKLLQELVRNDPSYTPNIEHLVFPDRRNSAVTSPITATAPPKANSNSKPTRSRLAEVFALSRYSHHSHQGGSVDSKSSKSSATTKTSKSSRKSLGSVSCSKFRKLSYQHHKNLIPHPARSMFRIQVLLSLSLSPLALRCM